CILFADRPAARRLPRLVHGLAAARDQIVPFGQRLIRGAKPICTSLGQPVEVAEILSVEFHAVGDALHPVLVIEAPAVPPVEQLARDVGRIEQPRLLILELVDAASPAAVAQGFPLAAVQRSKGLLPNTCSAIHDKSSLALLTPRDQA